MHKHVMVGVAMFVSLCAPASTWTDSKTGITWTYKIENGNACIGSESINVASISQQTAGDIVVPDVIGGYVVSRIGAYAFYYCKNIQTIKMPSSVRSIGKYAFQGCTALESIAIPDEVSQIAQGTFSCCERLTDVSWPSTITDIGSSAFYGCTGLTSIAISASITNLGWSAFESCSGLRTITVGCKDVGAFAFSKCSNLEAVNFQNVVNIGKHSFSYCEGLRSVVMPCSVKNIQEGAFQQCKKMSLLEIPPSVTNVESLAFVGCTNLKEVTISSGVKRFDYVFGSDTGIVTVYMVEGSTEVPAYMFSCCDEINEIVLPCSVTNIGERAFNACNGLKDVIIPYGVTHIGNSAFWGCKGLTNVVVSSTVKDIDYWAFFECSSLANLTISDGVKSLGARMCSECVGLRTVAIPASVTNVGAQAFWGCTGLTDVTISEGVQYYGSVFEQCTNIKNVKLVSGTTNIRDQWFNSHKELVKVDIPWGVTNIGRYAFRGCTGLTNIVIPASVRSIGFYAFNGCTGLTNMELPRGLQSIGTYAFQNCSGLRSLIIPSGVERIDQRAFENCTALKYIIIEDNVSGLDWCVFNGCNNISQVDFQGSPPEDLELASIKKDALVRYNMAYFDEWRCAIKTCGFTNAIPYDPDCEPVDGFVLFVVPNGTGSTRNHVYTNDVYGVLPEARRDGFAFAGWYTALDGTNRVTAFSPVDPKVTTLYARWVEDDASLYAQWSANAYSVSFNANGGDGEMVAQPFLYDQVKPLSGSTFTKLGYTFRGWSTSPDGEIVYSDKASVSNLTAEAGFAVALFAKWEKVIDVATETIEDWVAYDLALKFKKTGESGSAYRKRFEAKYGDDYAVAFFRETGKIGMDGTRLCVWHDYVAGTDPLDETSQFTASVTIVDGKPVVTYSPELSEEEKALRVYKTLGKAKLLDSEWVEVPSGHESEYHFFKVTVEMK